MSALGQKATSQHVRTMSAFAPNVLQKRVIAAAELVFEFSSSLSFANKELDDRIGLDRAC